MKNKLHIVVTGERETTRSYVMSKHSLATTILASVSVVITLAFFTFMGLRHSQQYGEAQNKLAQARQQLQAAQERVERVDAIIAEQVAEKEAEFAAIVGDLQQKSEKREELLSSALGELKTKSEIVESILKTVGIKTTIKESSKNSGGPFTPLTQDSYEDLIFKLDHSLDIIKSVPLGTPVYGAITSLYGRRIDPINNEVAFHSGIDISKRTGTSIATTADGVVSEKGYNDGHGNYVVVDHGKGFRTRYFHMKKSLVKKGDRVKRGQVIGQVGSTGRSTGPHLHYEIHYNAKSVNPLKFVRIARNVPSAGK